MERFVKGEVVVVGFPFSNLTISKNRPCLVIAELSGSDVIICEITSQPRKDVDLINLRQKDFQKGSLKINSWIRPNKLLTIDSSMIKYKIGMLKLEKIKSVERQLCEIFTR